jgi:hypothetical protein
MLSGEYRYNQDRTKQTMEQTERFNCALRGIMEAKGAESLKSLSV